MTNPTKAHPRLSSRLGALSLLTIAFVFGASVAPATAAAPQRWSSSHSNVDYVALGDSFTSGQGAPPYLSGPCLQSKYASYPIITATLSAVKLVANESCSGANTAAVIEQLGQLPNRLTGRNSRVRLVTLTVGGIDAGSNQVLQACTPDPNSATCQAALYFAVGQLSSPRLGITLAATYLAVADAMPNAKIVVFTYPQLFNNNVSQFGNTVNSATVALNATITGAAASVTGLGKHIQVVDVTPEFSNHGVGASVPYISFDPSNLTAPANFHPNALGNSLGYFQALLNDGVLDINKGGLFR
jgi:lysophospholipase L1-like esterase